MTNIEKGNVADYTITGEFDIESSVEGIDNTLRFVFDNEPLTNVIYWALKDRRINKQAHIRTHREMYDGVKIVRVPVKGGRTPVDPVVSIIALAQAAGMTPEEYMREEVKKRKAPQLEPLK